MDYSLETLYQHFTASTGVSTDSRSISEGQIFFALSGPNFDGNAYTRNALDKGAMLAVVSDPDFHDERAMLVSDVLVVLQDLARYHRDQLTMPVVGLTGSNGKTSTKELIRDVLASAHSVYATRGNLNNHIGVPLSVLEIPVDVDFAVIEMGANHQGEIALLSSICKPSHGLITNIGKAHLEGFGGIEGVKKGKSEIYHFLADNGGVAFVNRSENFLDDLSSHVASRVKYGLFDADEKNRPSDLDYNFSLLSSNPDIKIRIEGEDALVASPLFGAYNGQNVATAVAIGLYFDIPIDSIRSALSAYAGGDNRSQVMEMDGKKLILDAYNANPTSMVNAIRHFALSESESRAVIIGGMNELGGTSDLEHKRLVDLLAELEFDETYVVGSHFEGISLPEHFIHLKDTKTAIDYFTSNPVNSVSVFIKGSRSNALETLVDHLH